jgi:hypothetical protein
MISAQADRRECCLSDQSEAGFPTAASLRANPIAAVQLGSVSPALPKEKLMRQLSKALLTIALTAIAVFGADNSTGTWKLNVEKSKYGPGPMPLKSLTMVREAISGGIKSTVTGMQSDGTPINSAVMVKYDGTEAKVTGAPWDTLSVKQVDANTFTSVSKQTNGKFHSTGRTVVSKNGKTMTTTSKGTDVQGQPFTATFVYEKQ